VYILFQSSAFLNIKFCLLTFKLLSNSLNTTSSFLPFYLELMTIGSSSIFLANPFMRRPYFYTKIGRTSVRYLLFHKYIFCFSFNLCSFYFYCFSATKLLNIFCNNYILYYLFCLLDFCNKAIKKQQECSSLVHLLPFVIWL
jgi:hypothetical protein